MKALFIVILATTVVVASEAKSEILFKAEESTQTTEGKATEKYKALDHLKHTKSNTNTFTNQNGDLGLRSWSMIAQGQTTYTNQNATEILNDIKIGQTLSANIPISVMAFADGRCPVVADVRSEKGDMYRVLGEATVEKASKRISIEFKKLRLVGTDKVYDFKAEALDDNGMYGLEGEVHSGEGKFFLAELLSAAAAGFADASINRQTNAFGQAVDEHSLDTQSKKALASALSKSGEHFAEKLKTNNEYVTIDGPLVVRVVVLEGPKSN